MVFFFREVLIAGRSSKRCLAPSRLFTPWHLIQTSGQLDKFVVCSAQLSKRCTKAENYLWMKTSAVLVRGVAKADSGKIRQAPVPQFEIVWLPACFLHTRRNPGRSACRSPSAHPPGQARSRRRGSDKPLISPAKNFRTKMARMRDNGFQLLRDASGGVDMRLVRF